MSDISRLLADLVRRPSINPMGRALSGPQIFEHQVTDYLEDYFRTLGVPYERQSAAPLRDNIVARSPGDPARAILFEVHQDTVPVDGMTIDPFGGNIQNGRLYGRGACDIKGGMAAMLTAFARLFRERPAGAATLILACTVDEEHTGIGVRKLVDGGVRADMAVVCEPTSLQIVRAHKGVVRWRVEAPGRSYHSSRPDLGVNAIYRMGRLLGVIESYAQRLSESTRDPDLGPPTLSVGRIDGGSSVNTVPGSCHIDIDRRLVPGETPEAAWTHFRSAVTSAPGIDFPVGCGDPWTSGPPLGSKGAEDLIARLGKAIDSVKGPHEVVAVPYCTDAGIIAAAGIPAVVFGPGDIACAHTVDEWVSLEEVEAASEIMFRLVCG